jgi:tetratricopeptide (TPR) repeat protein
LREAVRLAPDSPEARYALALILRRQEKHEEAAQELELAAARRSEREALTAAVFATLTALRHMDRGDPSSAVDQLRLVVSSTPQFAPAHYQLSLALRKLGRAEEALAARRAAETLDPGLRFCRSSLGPRAWLQRRARTN